MVEIQPHWIKIDQKGFGPGARSSHAIAIVGQKLYAFGGEFKPRVPVDNHLYIFDLDDQSWSIVSDATGDIPPPRIGVTMAAVNDVIYVFGGRDAEHKELSEFYSFDTTSKTWALLSVGDLGPAHRSYHSTAADERHVYVFGGCGETGRLNDLSAYDVVNKKWIQFPSPGESLKGRGGPGLTVVQNKVWVVYGFIGKETDDVHYFDLTTKQWAEVETSGDKPTARSVFSSCSIGKYIFISGGEVDPSDQGHLGAGHFSGEAYALNTETLVWKKLDDGLNQPHHPGPRGWCAFSGGERDGKPGLLVYGGNSPSNNRLDDIHFFTPLGNSTENVLRLGDIHFF